MGSNEKKALEPCATHRLNVCCTCSWNTLILSFVKQRLSLSNEHDLIANMLEISRPSIS